MAKRKNLAEVLSTAPDPEAAAMAEAAIAEAEAENTPAEDPPEAQLAKIQGDIQQLLTGLNARGYTINLGNVDLNNIKARVESSAALAILVSKGICTEMEAFIACHSEMRLLLAAVLQTVEEMQAQAAAHIKAGGIREATLEDLRKPVRIARLDD